MADNIVALFAPTMMRCMADNIISHKAPDADKTFLVLRLVTSNDDLNLIEI